MGKLLVRSVVLLAFLAAIFFAPLQGLWSLAWNTALAVSFGITILYLTGPAPVFVPVSLFTSTALVPFLILCFIGWPVYGSWVASAAKMGAAIYRLNPLRGLELFIPTIVATGLTMSLGRRIGPNNSFKADGSAAA